MDLLIEIIKRSLRKPIEQARISTRLYIFFSARIADANTVQMEAISGKESVPDAKEENPAFSGCPENPISNPLAEDPLKLNLRGSFCLFCLLKGGRGDRIRTCDHRTPSPVRYQTAPRPAFTKYSDSFSYRQPVPVTKNWVTYLYGKI